MRVFAIDPGNTQSAYCVVDAETLRPLDFNKIPNNVLRDYIRDFRFEEEDRGVIEMIQSYGMAVGKDVFETAVWIGRFAERLDRKLLLPAEFLFRKEEKLHICHDSKAKDANIRRALIDRFARHDLKNGKGTKANPDWFYGFSADMWAAYAVALTYIETRLDAASLDSD